MIFFIVFRTFPIVKGVTWQIFGIFSSTNDTKEHERFFKQCSCFAKQRNDDPTTDFKAQSEK